MKTYRADALRPAYPHITRYEIRLASPWCRVQSCICRAHGYKASVPDDGIAGPWRVKMPKFTGWR